MTTAAIGIDFGTTNSVVALATSRRFGDDPQLRHPAGRRRRLSLGT